MPRLQGKYWCFTLNNYTAEEEQSIRELQPDSENPVSYLVFGREVGDSGTPHLQGYLELTKRLSLAGVKRLLGQRVHLERRGGSQEEADEYCKKDGDFEAFGSLNVSGQGRRTDLETIRSKIDDGVPELVIAEEHFSKWVVYRRSFEKYRRLKHHSNGIRDQLRVIVLWGEPGTGKTRYVYAKHPNVFAVPDPALCWFDGYSGEDVALIDDYRGDGNESFLLRLLDIYPIQVPVKGGFVDWCPKTIYITSNVIPPFGHTGIGSALERRLYRTVAFTEVLDVETVHGLIVGEGES